MSIEVSVGDYRLEVSNGEVLVRDQGGAIIETVALDRIRGDFTLPDGQKIDLASVLARNGIESVVPGAGPTSDNTDLAVTSLARFQPLQDDGGGTVGRASVGTLDGTSQHYVNVDRQPEHALDHASLRSVDTDEHTKSSDQTGSERSIPATWSSHDPWHVAENESGGSFGKLIDGNPADFAFQASDGRFEIVNGELKLKDGTSLDFESEPRIDATITATNGAGHSFQQNFTVTVTNVNEAPVASASSGSLESRTLGEHFYSTNDNGTFYRTSMILGVDISRLTLDTTADVSVTFQKEGAGYHSMLGFYQFDDAGGIIPGSIKFIWLDTTAESEYQAESPLIQDFLGFDQSSTMSLGSLPGGTHLGFFTISDGASDIDNIALLTNAASGTSSQQAAMAAIASQLTIQIDSNGNGHVFVGDTALWGTTFFSHDKTLNSDSGYEIEHMVSGISDPLGGQLLIGVEDAHGGGDRDYNDLVFSVNTGAYNMNKTSQSTLQPAVDFSDVDSTTLSQAVIHTSGFQIGDTLNVPPSDLFNVAIDHGSADYAVTITGKSGTETVDQYENFVNSIFFSTNTQIEGDRHIGYSVTDDGGLSSNIGTTDIAVTTSYDTSSSELGQDEATLGSGDDDLYINTDYIGHVHMGAGHDVVHLARQDISFGHDQAVLLGDVEALDTTGYGVNNVSLSLADVLDMTDDDNHLTVVGDKGDVVTLTGDGSGNHWAVADANADFTTFVWNDSIHQVFVEISNQLTAQAG